VVRYNDEKEEGLCWQQQLSLYAKKKNGIINRTRTPTEETIDEADKYDE